MDGGLGTFVLLAGAMFLVFFGGVAALVVLGLRRHRARVGSLQRFALAQGLTFADFDAFGLVDRWRGMPFDAGYSRRAHHVVTGDHAGRALVAFDYSYTENDMDGDPWTRELGVVAVRLRRPVPEVVVLPENVLSRIARGFGLPDATTGDAEFDRRHHVLAAEPASAPALLTPDVRGHLLAYGPVSVRFTGSDVVSWGRLLDPAELDRRARLLTAVADAVGG